MPTQMSSQTAAMLQGYIISRTQMITEKDNIFNPSRQYDRAVLRQHDRDKILLHTWMIVDHGC